MTTNRNETICFLPNQRSESESSMRKAVSGINWRITRIEKFDTLQLGFVEEVLKTDSKQKPRKSIVINSDWQVPFANIRLTVNIKESKDKNTRKEQYLACIRHMECPLALRKHSQELEKLLLDKSFVFQSTSYNPLKVNVNRLAQWTYYEMTTEITLCVIQLI